jgi:hypothetical protein
MKATFGIKMSYVQFVTFRQYAWYFKPFIKYDKYLAQHEGDNLSVHRVISLQKFDFQQYYCNWKYRKPAAVICPIFS